MTTETHSSQANILVVDDTPANLNVLSALLAQQGYKVRPANNGQVALVVAQHTAPDLILLDIQMPGFDGFEVCRRLKALDQTRDVPVIFISALDEVLDKVAAFKAGGVDYITKPFQILEVLARVEYQLALRRQRARLAELRALAGRLQDPTSQLAAGVSALAETNSAPADLVRRLVEAARAIQAIADELARLTVYSSTPPASP
jgi:DNA-binding response OmpR family regulator